MRSRLYFERFIKPYLERFRSKLLALNKRDVSPLPVSRVLQLFGRRDMEYLELVALNRDSCFRALEALLEVGGLAVEA